MKVKGFLGALVIEFLTKWKKRLNCMILHHKIVNFSNLRKRLISWNIYNFTSLPYPTPALGLDLWTFILL